MSSADDNGDDPNGATSSPESKGITISCAFGELLVRALGGPADLASEIAKEWLRDKYRLFREGRAERLAQKTKEALNERGVDGPTRPVPANMAFRIVEEATLEDDDYLQDLWARLLAAAMDPNAPPVRRALSGILQNLDPLDVKILSFLASQGWELFNIHWHEQGRNLREDVGPKGFTVARITEALHVDEADMRICLLNLGRLGCIQDEVQETLDSLDVTSAGLRIHNPKAIFRPTPLGFELVEACRARH